MLWVVWDVLKREIQGEGREVVEISCTRECHQLPCGDAWSGVLTTSMSRSSDTFRRLHA